MAIRKTGATGNNCETPKKDDKLPKQTKRKMKLTIGIICKQLKYQKKM